ncbi:MAG: sugar ABC transporter permease [Ardenticatenia bacterium]|nr:sugar ABC transporter permease [Ardenticatenia bacterium]
MSIPGKIGLGRRWTAFSLWFERRIKYWFVLPSVLYLLVLGIFPLVFSLFLVFASWQPGSGGIRFVGLRNLQNLATDERFWNSLMLTAMFVVVAVAVELILGAILALMMQARFAGNHLFRMAICIPILLTPIALSYTWRLMFDFTRGPINYFLTVVGLPGVMWLGSTKIVMFSIVLVDVWQWTPFVALVLLAALEGQDVELYEAATVDGATYLKMLRYIALPLLAPFFITVALLRSIDAIKVFDTVYVLTGGGPGTASEVITLYAYSAHFRTFNMGYMSALAWVMMIITIAIFFFFVRSFRRSRAA